MWPSSWNFRLAPSSPQVWFWQGRIRSKTLILKEFYWWEVQVSNLRPLQCECSALPLS